MINVSQLTCLMQDRGIATPSELVGVTDKEIQSLENHFGLSFPISYRQFLRSFGRSAGLLSPWMAIYFDDLKEIRDQFDCLLVADNIALNLPEKALLIANWESVFDFIICDGNDNPAVYRIDLYQTDPERVRLYSDSYGEYLEHLIRTTDTRSFPNDFFEDEPVDAAHDVIHF